MRHAIAILAALLVAASGSASHASEWWTSKDGESALEGWGYVKDSLMAAHFLGNDLHADDAGAYNSLKIRLGMDAYHEKLRFGVDLEFVCDTAFDGMTAGGNVFGTASGKRPRLADIPDFTFRGTSLTLNVDRLYFRYSAGPVDITVGRQAISWGSAWFWKPTDRFAPFSPTDIDPDVKRGVDAFRLESWLDDRTSLDIIATFERHPDDTLPVWTNAGARVRTTIDRYDLAVSIARFQGTSEGNWMVGFEFAGELPKKVGFRGEAALNVMENSRDVDVEAVIGVDYRFRTRTTLASEVMFNGYGASRTADYAMYLNGTGRGERLARQEAFNIGQWYLGVIVTQEITPLLNLSVSTIANLADPSAVFMGGLAWSAADNVMLKGGVMVPAGRQPAIAPANVPATPDVKSEFGLMPLVGYLVLKFSY